MPTFLHAMGEKLFEKKWWAVSVWLLALLALGSSALHYYKPASDSLSIPGTPAQVAIDRLGSLFPNAGRGSGRIVFHTTDKKVSDYQAPITEALAKVRAVKGVSNVVSPFDYAAAISSTGTTAYAQVQLEQGTGKIDTATTDAIATITDNLKSQGLEVERGGDLVNNKLGQILGGTELSGLAIALLVLILTFGALAAAGLPILNAVLGVGISMAGLYSLSQVMDINSTTPVLAVMLGLAVGIDYSLFIVSKYRSLLLAGHPYKAAAGKAVGTAGNAVVFAAATVVIALAALSVVRIPLMTSMGLTAAAGIAIAALVALTLSPAIFGIFGPWLFNKRTRAAIAEAQQRGAVPLHESEHATRWQAWGEQVVKHPWMAIIVSLAVVGVLAWPARSLELALPTDQHAAETSTQRRAYDLLTEAFGPGFNAPLIVIVDNVPQVTDADRAMVRQSVMAEYNKQVAIQSAAMTAQFQRKLAQAATVAEKQAVMAQIAAAQAQGEQQRQAGLAQVEKTIAQYAPLVELNKVAAALGTVSGVKAATPAMVTADGKTGLIQVIPQSGPSDQKTSDLIKYLRTHEVSASGLANAKLSITGTTAIQDDINQKLSDALPIYLVVVVGLSLILLLVAFRSVLVPIKATLGFLLSVGAMFGSMVYVFQQGHFGIASAAPLVTFMPIIGIGILFGLAMDYEFFLVSSMHEAYAHTKDPKQAIVTGFGVGAQVVAAAAIIMMAVFAGFIGNHMEIIRSIGFGLAVGIFVDAFIVRMIFVPAVMTLLGKASWWLPSWLEKLLPRVSIEGEEE